MTKVIITSKNGKKKIFYVSKWVFEKKENGYQLGLFHYDFKSSKYFKGLCKYEILKNDNSDIVFYGILIERIINSDSGLIEDTILLKSKKVEFYEKKYRFVQCMPVCFDELNKINKEM